MPPLNRRSFLAGAAMLASAPTMASAQGAGDVDIVVIGAGAAGIAAARRVLAAKRSVVVIEEFSDGLICVHVAPASFDRQTPRAYDVE